jgi:acetyltransferase-like isoleucine patch superfamily enzyme
MRLLIEVWVWWEWMWGFIPGRAGMLVRKITIAPFLSYSDTRARDMWHVRIPEFVHFWKPWNIVVGRDVRFGKYSQINAEAEIVIGNNVMMGPYVMVTTVTHGYETTTSVPMMKQNEHTGKVQIGNDVWIGGHVSILPGVCINEGIIVGAGGVVTTNLSESKGIYTGVPARLNKNRA